MINFNNKKGFALLYALLLSGAVLTVGVILMNIITKQLVFSSINRNSETSYYYAANSGRECLNYYAALYPANFYGKKNISGNLSVSFKQNPTFSCFGQTIQMEIGDSQDNKQSYILKDNIPVTLGDNKIDLTVTFNLNCILGNNQCVGGTLENESIAVIKSDGYSGVSGNRSTKRTALLVQKSF